MFFTTPRGEVVYIDEKFMKEGISIGGFRIYPLESFKKPTVRKGTSECYSVSPKMVECISKTSYGMIPFKINGATLAGSNRNMILMILDKIPTVVDGKLTYLVSETKETIEEVLKEDIEIAHLSASTESVQEILESVRTTQLQEIYNVMQNRERITEISDLLIKVIKKVSQGNPSFLSEIIKGDFITSWISEEVFEICPCSQKEILPIHSNCMNDIRYENGMYKKEKTQESCITVEEGNIKKYQCIDKD